MNEGQEKFFGFIMGRVQDGKQDEAKKLLEENFTRQANGTFNSEYLNEVMPKIMALLKPECAEEVKNVMSQFGSQHIS